MNSVAMYWAAGEKAAILALRVENPPVATVAKEWHKPSKRSMPANIKRMVSAKVRTTYMSHNRLAVSITLGLIFSKLTNEPSAENKRFPPILKNGRMATTSTMIPIPPIQCVSARQKSISLGTISMFLKIEDPVVVNPETHSKNASAKDGMEPENKYGKVPKRDMITHPILTMTKLSRTLGSRVDLCRWEATTAITPVPAMTRSE